MRKFILKLSLFLLLFIILNQLAYYSITYFYSYKAYDEQFSDILLVKPKEIILGDSHPFVLKQEYLGAKMYNFSYLGESVHGWLLKLQFCIKNNIPVKKVYLQLDPHILATYRAKLNRKKQTIHIFDYPSFQNVYNLSKWEYIKAGPIARYLPLADSYNADLFITKFANWAASKAGTTVKTAWPKLNDNARNSAALSRINQQLYSPYDARMVRSFLLLIELCRKNDIEILGIKYPVSVEHRKHLADVNVTQVYDLFEKCNLESIDFSERYSDLSCFENSDHLNDNTAREFAKVFLRETASE